MVQRLRIRYAKRGRLRFTSHRDFARAFERALRRAEIPMGYSAGFTPHPKISYVGAAPTGVASEAEYLEIGLAREMDPDAVRTALDAALPDGLDIMSVVPAGPGSFAEQIQASHWRVELSGVSGEQVGQPLQTLLGTSEFTVQRKTKDGQRSLDVRAAIVWARVSPGVPAPGSDRPRAILELVVRQATPAVRPDDVLVALQAVSAADGAAGLAFDAPPLAVRLAQGPLDPDGSVGDPLADSRIQTRTAP